MARIVTYQSNAWLVSANIAVLALTVYGCGLVNFPMLIANYNVAHARDIEASDQIIDLHYVASLGPQAIPALDQYVIAHTIPNRTYFISLRGQLAATHLKDTANWRAWSFRGWRLTRYLENTKAVTQ